MSLKPAIIIAGPTASGKSGLGLALAQDMGGVIVNADSLQVYRGLPLLTALPTEEDQLQAQHRLYAALAPDEPCNAHIWRDLALIEMETAYRQGQIPMIVGGTGLYIKGLVEGFSPLPESAPDVRAALTKELQETGNAAFHARLAAVDPESAAKIPAGNTQRLIRAMEVYVSSGKTLSFWHQQDPAPVPDWKFLVVTLLPPREELYASCDKRFEHMMNAGALEEVKSFERLYPRDVPLKKALGHSYLKDVKSEKDRADAVTASQQQTRNYAKRQVTWFRHQLTSNLILETPDPAAVKKAYQARFSCA